MAAAEGYQRWQRGAEDALDDSQQFRGGPCLPQRPHICGAEGNHLCGGRRCDAELASHVPVHFQDFDLEHELAAGPFDLLKESHSQCHVFGGVAQGKGASARVQLGVGDADNLAQQSDRFRHSLRRSRGRQQDCPHDHRGVLVPLGRCVLRHEKRVSVERFPEGSGLLAEHRHRGGKVHAPYPEMDRPPGQIGVERGDNTELARYVLISRADVAAMIEVAGTSLRLELHGGFGLRAARKWRRGQLRLRRLWWRKLRQAFARHREAWVELQRGAEFLAGVLHPSGQGFSLGTVRVLLHYPEACRLAPQDQVSVARRVGRGF